MLLTVWDKLLGTFHAEPPRPITAKDLGVDELPNFPKGFVEQLILPFVYAPGKGEPERYKKASAKTPAQEARAQVLDAAE
jgi:hypothetical protein